MKREEFVTFIIVTALIAAGFGLGVLHCSIAKSAEPSVGVYAGGERPMVGDVVKLAPNEPDNILVRDKEYVVEKVLYGAIVYLIGEPDFYAKRFVLVCRAAKASPQRRIFRWRLFTGGQNAPRR